MNKKSPIDQPKNDEKPPPLSYSKCLISLGKGLPHNCNQSTYRKNIKDLVAKDSKAAERIAASVVAQKPVSQ